MKRGCSLVLYSLFFLILLVSSLCLISAENVTVSASPNLNNFDKSYACLTEQVSSKGVSALSVEELAFSLLALGYNKTMQDSLKDELEIRKDANNCWPKGACTLKETSQVLLAYDHIDKETSTLDSWLLNQTMPPTELVWYLQLDNPTNEKTQCSVVYDNSTKTVTINEDKTIIGSLGNCLTSAYNGYWLEIKTNCYDKDFTVTCDKDFITSTIYKKKTTSTIFVSATTNIGHAASSTTEKIQSLCFKQGTSCNYEGSLWAALAVHKKGQDIKKFIPYLIASSSDSTNQKFLPSAFLYSLTDFAEYYTELTNQQKTEGYWQTTSDQTKRYYDTALALYTLYGKSTGQADSAIQYLLKPSVQGTGCWGNSIRDTAFLSYAASPKQAVSGGGLNPRTLCTSSDFPSYSCVAQSKCEDLNGSTLSNFYCLGGADICCNKKETLPSCSQLNGETCLSSEECSGGEYKRALDTSYCCINGECKQQEILVNYCEEANYTCRAQQCNSNEVQKVSLDCSLASEYCCGPASSPAGKKSYMWIILLVILIILLILAIIFRDQLKIWFFKVKSKFSKTPVTPQNRPYQPSQMPPARPMPGAMPRRIIPGAMPPGMLPRPGLPPRPGMPPQQRPFPKDKELEETLKKLKDMSK